MSLPLNKHPEPSHTVDHIEIIMPPLVVFLLDTHGLPAQNAPIFSSETIDKAYAWLSRYAPSKFNRGMECNYLSNIQANNNVLVHCIMCVLIRPIGFFFIDAQKNDSHPSGSQVKASLEEVTGHAGHVYESITVADLQDDIAQIMNSIAKPSSVRTTQSVQKRNSPSIIFSLLRRTIRVESRASFKSHK